MKSEARQHGFRFRFDQMGFVMYQAVLDVVECSKRALVFWGCMILYRRELIDETAINATNDIMMRWLASLMPATRKIPQVNKPKVITVEMATNHR